MRLRFALMLPLVARFHTPQAWVSQGLAFETWDFTGHVRCHLVDSFRSLD